MNGSDWDRVWLNAVGISGAVTEVLPQDMRRQAHVGAMGWILARSQANRQNHQVLCFQQKLLRAMIRHHNSNQLQAQHN